MNIYKMPLPIFKTLVLWLLCIDLSFGEIDKTEVDVWEFRTQDLSNNSRVKAFYSSSAPQWQQDLEEYTLCFRYQLYYVTPENLGTVLIASSSKNNHLLNFYIATEVPNSIQAGGVNNEDHYIFYNARVPIRQWITMCLLKSLKDQKLRILNNENTVYSYNECMTIAEIKGSGTGGAKKDNVPCYEGEWTINGKKPGKSINACTDEGSRTSYWCPVAVNQTTKEYSYENDPWGFCALNCMDTLDEKNDILATKPLSKDLLNNLHFGAENDATHSFKGKISDVNIWDRMLSDAEVNDYIFCQKSSIFENAKVSWSNPSKFWTLAKDGNALKETKTKRGSLCERQNATYTYGFSRPRRYSTALKLCSSLNGHLPLPESKEVEKELWERLRESCKDGRIWLGITDFQEEGKFLNITGYNYKEVFKNYRQTVGQPLTETRWFASQPNGGVTENCGSTTIDKGWADRSCEQRGCTACTVNNNQLFKLRGLCPLTRFDTSYSIMSDDGLDPYFIGLHGWNMTFTPEVKGYKLWNSLDSSRKDVFAIYNDTEEVPAGLKIWNVYNDNCPGGDSKKYLVLSNCAVDQFTCNDGSCIKLINRCDNVFHCEDNSDEFYCEIVDVDQSSYSKDIAPTPVEQTEDRLKVEVDISNFQVLKIDDVEEDVNVGLKLTLTWKDPRVTFTNLKPYKITQLSSHETKKLWHPAIKFKESISESKTKKYDDEEVLEALSETVHLDRTLDELRERYYFVGHETNLHYHRTHDEQLACQFELNRYPFDFQTCTLTLSLLDKQKHSVQLEPKHDPWPIKFPEDQRTVGEFFLEDAEVKQPENSDKTELVIEFQVKRSFWKVFTTTYMPTIILLVIVQMTFYFPLENIQVRATVVLSCFLILSTLLIGATSTTTSGLTYLQIWIIFAVMFTFLDIGLQVYITYLKQLETKDDEIHKTSKVNDVCLRIAIVNKKAKTYGQKALKLNYYGGKICSPIFLGVFTLAYFSYSFGQYYSF